MSIDRRLVLKIETNYSEDYFRKNHGDKGPDMTDSDLKSFSIDDFIYDIEQSCKNGTLKEYVQFYFE